VDQLKSLGRRDIFGILLPGAIFVFVSVYALFGVLSVLDLQSRIGELLEYEFLLTIVLFVMVYLVGSLLRLFAADSVDQECSEYLLKGWYKDRKAGSFSIADFEGRREELAKGQDVADVPDGFDDWLFGMEEFPYPAWQNRKWQAQGPREVLDFFRRKEYLSSMWSGNKVAPKDFFNHCKLVVIEKDGPLADEVAMAEGLTRFFAGTVSAFRWAFRVLMVPSVIQLSFDVIALIFILKLNAHAFLGVLVGFPYIRWMFTLTLVTLALMGAVGWMRRHIVKRFKRIRSKEVTIVYHAFYLDWMARQEARENEGTGGASL
jgi:hypothetical protein